MFDLEREIAKWSGSVHADRCRGTASTAELVDHLHCEIDRAKAEGMADEAAFHAAVTRLGRGQDLAVEHAKNRSWLGAVCAAEARYERSVPGSRGPLLAHAVVWASLILAISIVLSKSSATDAATMLLLVVSVPSWWASEQILRAALRRGRSGGSR